MVSLPVLVVVWAFCRLARSALPSTPEELNAFQLIEHNVQEADKPYVDYTAFYPNETDVRLERRAEPPWTRGTLTVTADGLTFIVTTWTTLSWHWQTFGATTVTRTLTIPYTVTSESVRTSIISGQTVLYTDTHTSTSIKTTQDHSLSTPPPRKTQGAGPTSLPSNLTSLTTQPAEPPSSSSTPTGVLSTTQASSALSLPSSAFTGQLSLLSSSNFLTSKTLISSVASSSLTSGSAASTPSARSQSSPASSNPVGPVGSKALTIPQSSNSVSRTSGLSSSPSRRDRSSISNDRSFPSVVYASGASSSQSSHALVGSSASAKTEMTAPASSTWQSSGDLRTATRSQSKLTRGSASSDHLTSSSNSALASSVSALQSTPGVAASSSFKATVSASPLFSSAAMPRSAAANSSSHAQSPASSQQMSSRLASKFASSTSGTQGSKGVDSFSSLEVLESSRVSSVASSAPTSKLAVSSSRSGSLESSFHVKSLSSALYPRPDTLSSSSLPLTSSPTVRSGSKASVAVSPSRSFSEVSWSGSRSNWLMSSETRRQSTASALHSLPLSSFTRSHTVSSVISHVVPSSASSPRAVDTARKFSSIRRIPSSFNTRVGSKSSLNSDALHTMGSSSSRSNAFTGVSSSPLALPLLSTSEILSRGSATASPSHRSSLSSSVVRKSLSSSSPILSSNGDSRLLSSDAQSSTSYTMQLSSYTSKNTADSTSSYRSRTSLSATPRFSDVKSSARRWSASFPKLTIVSSSAVPYQSLGPSFFKNSSSDSQISITRSSSAATAGSFTYTAPWTSNSNFSPSTRRLDIETLASSSSFSTPDSHSVSTPSISPSGTLIPSEPAKPIHSDLSGVSTIVSQASSRGVPPKLFSTTSNHQQTGRPSAAASSRTGVISSLAQSPTLVTATGPLSLSSTTPLSATSHYSIARSATYGSPVAPGSIVHSKNLRSAYSASGTGYGDTLSTGATLTSSAQSSLTQTNSESSLPGLATPGSTSTRSPSLTESTSSSSSSQQEPSTVRVTVSTPITVKTLGTILTMSFPTNNAMSHTTKASDLQRRSSSLPASPDLSESSDKGVSSHQSTIVVTSATTTSVVATSALHCVSSTEAPVSESTGLRSTPFEQGGSTKTITVSVDTPTVITTVGTTITVKHPTILTIPCTTAADSGQGSLQVVTSTLSLPTALGPDETGQSTSAVRGGSNYHTRSADVSQRSLISSAGIPITITFTTGSPTRSSQVSAGLPNFEISASDAGRSDATVEIATNSLSAGFTKSNDTPRGVATHGLPASSTVSDAPQGTAAPGSFSSSMEGSYDPPGTAEHISSASSTVSDAPQETATPGPFSSSMEGNYAPQGTAEHVSSAGSTGENDVPRATAAYGPSASSIEGNDAPRRTATSEALTGIAKGDDVSTSASSVSKTHSSAVSASAARNAVTAAVTSADATGGSTPKSPQRFGSVEPHGGTTEAAASYATGVSLPASFFAPSSGGSGSAVSSGLSVPSANVGSKRRVSSIMTLILLPVVAILV